MSLVRAGIDIVSINTEITGGLGMPRMCRVHRCKSGSFRRACCPASTMFRGGLGGSSCSVYVAGRVRRRRKLTKGIVSQIMCGKMSIPRISLHGVGGRKCFLFTKQVSSSGKLLRLLGTCSICVGRSEVGQRL